MQIALDTDTNAYTIRAYAPGEIRVNAPVNASGVETTPGADPSRSLGPRYQTLTRSLIISPQRLITDWAPQRFEELSGVHFEALVELEPEVVLLGSGGDLRWPRPELLKPLIRRRIGVEVMDTGAACRTYNILACEGRRVAAALLVIAAANVQD